MATSTTLEKDQTAGGTPTLLRRLLGGVILVFLSSSFFSIAVNSIALGLIAILWIVVMVSERRFGVRPTPLDYFFLAYVVAEMLSTVFSYNREQSFMLSKRLLLIGIVYMLASLIDSTKSLKRAVVVLLGTASVVGCIGVLKLLFAPPEETVRLGIFQFYMTTSGMTMIAALMLLAFIAHPGTPARIRWAAVLAALPILISLYATVTRGSYLGFAAGAVVVALIRNKMLLIPLVAVVLLVVLFASPYVESRIKSIFDIHHPENASRMMLWKTGLRMWAEYPVFGIGDIDAHELYLQYMDPDDPAEHGHFHNVPMQFLVTLGTFGFIVVMAMFVQIVRVEWNAYRKLKQDWFAGSLALGALAVFTGFHVAGLTEWTFGDQEVVILFWISLGFTLAALRLTPPENQGSA